MKTSLLVVFHQDCPDGFGAAWLAYLAYARLGRAGTVDFHPAAHGSVPPDCTGKRVLIVDFSYPRPLLLAMALQAESVTVLDHHQTAQTALVGFAAECAGLGTRAEVVFDMTKSGMRLTWDYLHGLGALPLKDRPWLVDYVEDRDLWRWALPQSREINAALAAYPRDFSTWDALANRPTRELALEGESIVRRERQIVAEHVARAYEADLDGHMVLCVNGTTLFSDIAGQLAQGRPFGVCWFVHGNGQRQYSLRSTEDGIDVATLAERHGGGGHPHAAGFRSSTAVEIPTIPIRPTR